MFQSNGLEKIETETTSYSIACPKCETKISITKALGADIKAHCKKEFQQSIIERNQEMEVLKNTIEKEEETLEQEKKNFEEVVAKRIQAEKFALEKKTKENLIAKNQLETQDLRNQLVEKNKWIEKSEIYELELRKKATEIEDKEKNLELELQRKFELKNGRSKKKLPNKF